MNAKQQQQTPPSVQLNRLAGDEEPPDFRLWCVHVPTSRGVMTYPVPAAVNTACARAEASLCAPRPNTEGQLSL